MFIKSISFQVNAKISPFLAPVKNNKNIYLFKDKNYIAKETIRRNFNKYIAISGVKHIRIHDLRHSHASLLIHLKQDPLVIKKRLGHADIHTTLNTYSHLYEQSDFDLVEQLNLLNNSK